jgi:hypothetical protein
VHFLWEPLCRHATIVRPRSLQVCHSPARAHTLSRIAEPYRVLGEHLCTFHGSRCANSAPLCARWLAALALLPHVRDT